MTTEMPKVFFRPGRALLAELDARGQRGLVAKRDAQRLYALYAEADVGTTEREARRWYGAWRRMTDSQWATYLEKQGAPALEAMAITDAIERAHRLPADEWTIVEALREVGLIDALTRSPNCSPEGNEPA